LHGCKTAQLPILLLGAIPFRDEVAIRRWQRDSGVDGTLEPMRQLKSVEMRAVVPDLFGKEVPLTPREQDFITLTAPASARVFLGLEGKDEAGRTRRFDPIFSTSWGFVWLSPYVTFNASGTQRFYYIQPLKLIREWLGQSVFPAPDTTTRLGRRLFFSHIDGDGFAMKASRIGKPTCAEVIRDNVLKRYPFPVTVSIVESDIRGLAWSLQQENSPRYEGLAREIFALKHVEAASHSYSHPFIWDIHDPNPGEYPRPFAPLNPEAGYEKLDLRREIEGSVRYIEDRLLPAGKKVGLMLWSGNCRPGMEALRITREMGLENLNGGDTTFSELYPSTINIAPKLMQWGDELQIHAGNQNEFMYADGFAGPFYGGFSKVIDTFERTEVPRRMKPVNVYYHFYSGINISAERALRRILDWCWQKPLHAITATEYSKIVRASREAQVWQLAPGHWMLRAPSALQTWRLPSGIGLPSLKTCRGIVGYRVAGEVMYVHTAGGTEAELKLVPTDVAQSVPHLHVSESSGPITVSLHTQNELHLRQQGLLPIKVILAGLPAGTSCEAELIHKEGKVSQSLTTDANGQLSILVAEGRELRLKARLSMPAP
jgi:polysaccharide biosynthesis protein PelA